MDRVVVVVVVVGEVGEERVDEGVGPPGDDGQDPLAAIEATAVAPRERKEDDGCASASGGTPRKMTVAASTGLSSSCPIYRCKHCDSHLAYAQNIISKMFRCKHGKAYLFDKVVNVVAGESEDDRMMTTGLHTVRDIFCVACGAILGWKYVSAFEKDQRYKEGKFILERCRCSWRCSPGSWSVQR